MLVGVVRAWIDEASVKVHAASAIGSVPRSRPIVPVRITVADRRAIHVPGIDKVIRISTQSVRRSRAWSASIIWVCATVVSWICSVIYAGNYKLPEFIIGFLGLITAFR